MLLREVLGKADVAGTRMGFHALESRDPGGHCGYLAVGLTIFFIGLFKKTVVADGIASYVGPVFSSYESGTHLPLLDAWAGVICYSFQLYFDFSAYSDMAIGLALLFGFMLPANFNSPYKSVSIRDFWRRWHMTLSRFLRDYLYIPMGGNRHGAVPQSAEQHGDQ